MNTKSQSMLRPILLALLFGLALLPTTFQASAASASPPDLMSYQGYLVDVNGAPLASSTPANYPIVFRIYDASTGGNVIWSEQQIVTVDKGNFSVVLGEGTAVSGEARPALSSAFLGADSSDRYLGITVTISGTTMTISPRLRLLPAPYAFAATKASALVNSAGANLISTSGGNVGIGTTNPELQLDVRGHVKLGTPGQTIQFEPQSGFTRVAFNGLTFWDWDGGGDMVTFSNGKVGIGTTTPATALDVRGAGATITVGTSTGEEGALFLGNSAHGLKRSYPDTGNNNIGLYTTAGDIYLSGNGKLTTHLVVKNSGNVGIGTASPATLLQVGKGDNVLVGGILINTGWIDANQARPLDVQVRGDSKFVVTSTGNVGLGTTAPLGGLDVSPPTGANSWTYLRGNAGGANPSSAAVTGLAIGWNKSGGNGETHILYGTGAGGAPRLVFGSWNGSAIGPVMTVRNGRVGIGTEDPAQAKLVVDGTSGTDSIGQHYTLMSHQLSGPHQGSWNMTDVSIKGTHAIHAAHFRAVSDARIKNIQGRSDGNTDLETLRRIEVTDYLYKDVTRGNRPQKKVIGQQVEQVFPQAVVTSVDVVPDIYRKATVQNGWVDLATNLQMGDRVRLISKTQQGIYEVLEVTPDKFRTDFNPQEDELFVFGREVKDFRVVDYEAISMLNVSATQELARRIEALESREARMEELENKAARVDALEEQVAKLQKLVTDLAAAMRNSANAVANVSPIDALDSAEGE